MPDGMRQQNLLPETSKAIVQPKELLSNEKIILQKGLRSLVDKNAHVGVNIMYPARSISNKPCIGTIHTKRSYPHY